MYSPFPTSPGNYSFLYFCRFDTEGQSPEKLADYLSAFTDAENFFIGFDRDLWSVLSSGQMPSQLYGFNFYGSDKGCEVFAGVFILFSSEAVANFPEFIKVETVELDSLTCNEGEIAEVFEEDEEFKDCFYGTCLIWENFESEIPVANKVLNVWFGKKVQLLVGKSIYSQDDWVEAYFNNPAYNEGDKVAYAAHLLFPNIEKLNSFKETVLDKEKVHLDDEIKGIFC